MTLGRRHTNATVRVGILPAAIALAIVLLVGVCVDTAGAETYTFMFTGRVTSLRDGLGVFELQVGEQTMFSGEFTFDTETPPVAPLPPDAHEAVYWHRAPPAGVSVQLGNAAFRTTGDAVDFRVWVRNDFGDPRADVYGFASIRNEAEGLAADWPLDVLEIDWEASTTEADLFDDLSMPVTPPSLAVLGGGRFHIYGECFVCAAPNATFDVWGELTTLTSASAPKTGDLDGDGVVGTADVAMLVAELGWNGGDGSASASPADVDGDGRVGLADLMMLHANLSASVVESPSLRGGAAARLDHGGQSVPEPAASILVAASAAFLAARRKLSLRRR